MKTLMFIETFMAIFISMKILNCSLTELAEGGLTSVVTVLCCSAAIGVITVLLICTISVIKTILDIIG